MSKITNEPKNRNVLIRKVRELLEHRALWMYFLCDEAEKKGLNPDEYASEAIRRCGLYQGKGLIEKGKTTSLKGLKKKQFSKPARMIFEMKILRSTDDNLDVDFHYCPLVKAWQKQGCGDEQISKLCDFAMYGDRGIAESYGCELELPKTIARGDEACEIRFIRKK
ncbi:L-2-amino-thiazoline-4-carboxylic acid hydrolase [Brucepastera parasyntrophica]|uniref:L-2-amino-thiazoline-4-carboxylic acid hydrolase n=1 Tax=Brucepastera parasyntrophica TaxID=2880008 RepID=UPI00210DBF41|nr:L-2-amino-thiazoline-4-carboxylic acid hydrolase [Brucepastera parasyntrophica]ULQ59491.1 L-2-amino-thiazoline-4-carboxylic acid hydrolase [Brucepastera parasyntrophica]